MCVSLLAKKSQLQTFPVINGALAGRLSLLAGVIPADYGLSEPHIKTMTFLLSRHCQLSLLHRECAATSTSPQPQPETQPPHTQSAAGWLTHHMSPPYPLDGCTEVSVWPAAYARCCPGSCGSWL